MAMQIVMDHTGDTRHYFEIGDVEAISKAEARFKALTSLGYRPRSETRPVMLRSFGLSIRQQKKRSSIRDLSAADRRRYVYAAVDFRTATSAELFGYMLPLVFDPARALQGCRRTSGGPGNKVATRMAFSRSTCAVRCVENLRGCRRELRKTLSHQLWHGQ